MIESVVYRNLKGTREAEIALPGCSLLTGGNGTGKTTLIQAIKLLLSGSLPEDKVSGTADVFKLANSAPNVNFMDVEMGITGGRLINRSWERTVKRDPASGESTESVSQEITLSPYDGPDKIADKEATIRQWAGVDPVVVDVTAFLGMSDNKRRDFFYQLGEASGVTGKRIRTVLEGRAEDMAELSKAVFRELAGELARLHGGNLDTALKWLADQQSKANKEFRQAQGAAVQMAKVQAERDTVTGNLQSLKDELARTRENKEQVASEISKNEALVSAINERQGRIDSLTARIARLKDSGSQEELKKLRTEKGELEKQLAALEKSNVANLKKLETAHQRATTALAAAGEKTGEAYDKMLELTARQEAFGEIEDIEDKLCKKCRGLFTEQADLSAPVDTASTAYETAQGKQKELEQKAFTAAKDHQTAKSGGDQKEFDLRNGINTLGTKIGQAESGGVENKDDLADLERELKEVQAKRLERPVSVDNLKRQLDGLKARIEELDGQLDKLQESENELNIQLRSVADAGEAETRLYCVKQMVKALGPAGLKGDLVKETLEPIKAEVNESLRLFGAVGVEFNFRMVDGRGQEIFDFGWNNSSGNYVAFDSLSTGQQCILLACLVAVICKHGSSPLKLLALDNLEVISADYEVAFFRGLPKVAEYCGLDNLIAATSKILPPAVKMIDGMKIIQFPLVQSAVAATA